MKHYLDLVPISAKIHKKQSRMSIFCIVLAVFLVTTIFGMADMFIRSQILQAQQESGNWHIAIKNISNEEAAIIASRPDIEVFSPYGVLNYRGDLGYTLGGKDVAICGCDESYITEIWTDQLEEGVFPQTSNEALVTENAKQIMGVAIGDPIAVETPDGDKLNFTISGFMNNTASIMSGDSYGIILNTEDYCAIYPNVGIALKNSGLRKRKIAHKTQMTTIPMEIPTGIAKRHQLSASFRTKRITCFGVAPIQRIRPKNSVRWATLLFRLLAIIIIPANITSTNNTAAAK